MKDQIMKELIPLTQNDCFTVFSRIKSSFDFPLHTHDEFELNLILNGKGVQRVVGDHIGELEEVELVLVGSGVPHAWFTHKCTNEEIREVTIQFHKDLIDEKLLRRNQLAFIRKMFEQSVRGILFSPETTRMLIDRLLNLNQKHGFDSVLELFSILHDLSVSRNMKFLSDVTFTANRTPSYNSRRIEKAMEYLHANFEKNITLGDVARLANMTETAFSRFFKTRTGINFIDSLNDIRLGHASRLLIETTGSVSEIAYNCGFNNMANFNRIFKRKKGCTPKEFRENYYKTSGVRVFI
ncbi:AraC family transcriptional regulator [Paracnuella aquatica]|uniref:AraC family transcriptional regulator n=1 Tax=Paracnuella aquatica TaxID=2268757 RepID=UPI000DEF19B2|nr:AraC family transcriptional regulator [Paracnuella aquatica]RPD43994.1 AraC family transcriptional regulator [Paracnuella aquatica]